MLGTYPRLVAAPARFIPSSRQYIRNPRRSGCVLAISWAVSKGLTSLDRRNRAVRSRWTPDCTEIEGAFAAQRRLRSTDESSAAALRARLPTLSTKYSSRWATSQPPERRRGESSRIDPIAAPLRTPSRAPVRPSSPAPYARAPPDGHRWPSTAPDGASAPVPRSGSSSRRRRDRPRTAHHRRSSRAAPGAVRRDSAGRDSS